MIMEKSSFVLVFGNSPFVRVLDFFLNFDNFDYSIAQIAKETETKWESVVKCVEVLMKKKIVKKTRKVGKAQLYMVNKESPLTGLLEDIDMKISDFFVKKELGRQKVVVG